jgi:ribulose-phosphate 3-epimerase
MVKLAPSILSADFSELGNAVKDLERYGADFIHIDVMDGNFVPNISLGIPVIKSIRSKTNLPFDVHLMMDNPSRYIEDFKKAGADIITVHYEAESHLDRTISEIKKLGLKAAVALNPATSTSLIKDLIPMLDMVLIMSVNPGFGGQHFIEYTKEKIKEIKQMSDAKNKELLIEVDGGVDEKNVGELVKLGANVIVAGSAVFKNNDIENNIKRIKKAM